MLVNFLIEKFSFDIAALILGVILCMVVPYLFGSLNFAIIISKMFYHDDIRKYGSGNAGTTNMLRTYGKLPAAATLLLDMSKGALSVLFGFLILGNTFGTYLAGLFAVLGHMFPCFYRFKGGKGVATTAVVILCTNPIVFAILLAIFLVIVIGTKMISLGSVMCMLFYPLLLYRFTSENAKAGVLISFVIAALVIFMHRSNIKRIWEGKESKISFKKHQKVPTAETSEESVTDTETASEPKSGAPDTNTSKKKLKNQKKQNK